MGTEHHTHVAFADESNWNQGRFRSIALVTAPLASARAFHRDLEALRKYLGASEFKWKKARRKYGVALLDFFFKHHARMRVDVLIWDTEDSRRKDVRGRDDREDFACMYFHLLHNVLKFRWPVRSSWLICPDAKKDVDWQTLEQCLEWKSWAREQNLFSQCGEMQELRAFYNISEIRPASSKEYFLIQLADLFAGLAVFSYAGFEKYVQWKTDQEETLKLFEMRDFGMTKAPLSRSDQERLPVLHHVREESGRRRLQVSLVSSRGLLTKNPANPLNFWLYTPQRPQDKAPVKRTL
jgi:hypothetical protein